MKPRATQLHDEPVELPTSPLAPPILSFVGGRNWRLEADFWFPSAGRVITIAKGFLFDLSSVPRLLWWLIAPFELSVVAPLIHDFLYRYGGKPPAGSIEPPHEYTRAEVDGVFRRIMEAENVVGWRRMFGYVAVRLFGFWAWRKDAQAR
ncbi:MAG: DUF1353 domain-containing protein [Acidimicrobiia bacterium]